MSIFTLFFHFLHPCGPFWRGGEFFHFLTTSLFTSPIGAGGENGKLLNHKKLWITDSDVQIQMATHNGLTPCDVCEALVQQVKKSNLNFYICETPFTVSLHQETRSSQCSKNFKHPHWRFCSSVCSLTVK